MKLTQYQVDAFATRVFEGNPAAVCPLEAWLAADDYLAVYEHEAIVRSLPTWRSSRRWTAGG